MIDGCLDWQANGLIRPAVVTTSTADYFSDQDLVAHWIDECCERTDEDGIPAKDTTASLIASWRNYAKSRGEEPGGSRKFSMALRSRGFTRFKNEHGVRGRGFVGIKVRVLHFEPSPDAN
jgi:putative DNA primase/helicase